MSAKTNLSMKYYTLDRVKALDAHYMMIVGERSNGKTTAVLMDILERYSKNEGNGVYLRQMEADISARQARAVFESLMHGGENKDLNLIDIATGGLYQDVKYRSKAWYLGSHVVLSDGTDSVEWEDKPFCFAMALSTMKHDKGATPSNVTTVVFDEFQAFDGVVLEKEVDLFFNTISTIVRDAARTKVYLVSNTNSWNSPYFKAFGIDKKIMSMKPGDITVARHTKQRKYDTIEMRVAIEYCESTAETRGGKDSDVYFVTATSGTSMITEGNFAVPYYPRCPHHFTGNNVKLTWWVVRATSEGDEYIRCRLMKIEQDTFVFADSVRVDQFERLYNDRRDVVYSMEFSGNLNHYISPTTAYPNDERTRILAQYLIMGRMFFEDNAVGENLMYYVSESETRSLRNLRG